MQQAHLFPRECALAMSLVSWSLSLSPSKILRQPCCGFKQQQQQQQLHHGFASARFPVVRPVSRGAYPSREFEICSELGLNEVAPPVSNVFGTETTTEEVSILEDPARFFYHRLETKVQKVQQALHSVGESVAPSPFSPTQGDDIVGFFLISVFLVLLFWVGNYLAPTWIFKDTVFGENKDYDGVGNAPRKLMEEEVDPADLIELPTNLQPFRGIVVQGFKAGRQKARDEAEARRRKKSEKGK